MLMETPNDPTMKPLTDEDMMVRHIMSDEDCDACGAQLGEDCATISNGRCELCIMSQDEHMMEDNLTDVEADADTLASCGWGTDEDYGGCDEWF